MDTKDWTDEDWKDAERCIASAKAVNKAYVDSINNQVELTVTRFTDAGISLVFARKLAERCVQNALYDIQTDLGGWNV